MGLAHEFYQKAKREAEQAHIRLEELEEIRRAIDGLSGISLVPQFLQEVEDQKSWHLAAVDEARTLMESLEPLAGPRVTYDVAAIAQEVMPAAAPSARAWEVAPTTREPEVRQAFDDERPPANGYHPKTYVERILSIFREHHRLTPSEVRDRLTDMIGRRPPPGTVSKTISDLKKTGRIERVGTAEYEYVWG